MLQVHAFEWGKPKGMLEKLQILRKYLKSHLLTNGLIFIYKGQDLTAICSSFRVVNEELSNEEAEKQHKSPLQ